jgi:hypothetical protein
MPKPEQSPQAGTLRLGELGRRENEKPLCIQSERQIVAGMTRRQWSGILVLCAAASVFLLASCSLGDPSVPTPATHVMKGTNSVGY